MFKIALATAVLLIAVLPSVLAAAPAVCWQITGWDSADMAQLARVSCCTTPAGFGWTFVNWAPAEQNFLGNRSNHHMKYGFIDYLGIDANGVPKLRWDFPLCCDNDDFVDGASPLVAGNCVDHVPLPTIIVSTVDGVFGTSQNTHNFVRKHWTSTWETAFVAHTAPAVIPGSLVEDIQYSAWGVVYGVNAAGQIVAMGNDGTSLVTSVLSATSGVDPFSLAPSNGNQLFGVTTGGQLFHLDVLGQMKSVPHWGASLVPESLTPGGGASIYGVNTAGQIFGTWDNRGVVTFALSPRRRTSTPNPWWRTTMGCSTSPTVAISTGVGGTARRFKSSRSRTGAVTWCRSR